MDFRVTEIDLAEDVKLALRFNRAIKASNEFRGRLSKIDANELVKYDKVLKDGLTFENVEIVTDEMIAESFGAATTA